MKESTVLKSNNYQVKYKLNLTCGGDANELYDIIVNQQITDELAWG